MWCASHEAPYLLQRVAVGCSVLQCVAMCCSVLQCEWRRGCYVVRVAWGKISAAMSYNELQCVAVCCSVLQCVAVCCSVLQCVAVCCSVPQCIALCCSVLQYVAVCCSVLQCVAACCSVLQCEWRRIMWCTPHELHVYHPLISDIHTLCSGCVDRYTYPLICMSDIHTSDIHTL